LNPIGKPNGPEHADISLPVAHGAGIFPGKTFLAEQRVYKRTFFVVFNVDPYFAGENPVFDEKLI